MERYPKIHDVCWVTQFDNRYYGNVGDHSEGEDRQGRERDDVTAETEDRTAINPGIDVLMVKRTSETKGGEAAVSRINLSARMRRGPVPKNRL